MNWSNQAGVTWHPEGVYELTGYDRYNWPLHRYGECLDDLSQLNACMRISYHRLKATREQRLPAEKEELRYAGLELLRDVDNEEDS